MNQQQICLHFLSISLSVCLCVTLQLGGALRPNTGVCYMSNASTPVYYDMNIALEYVRVLLKHNYCYYKDTQAMLSAYLCTCICMCVYT